MLPDIIDADKIGRASKGAAIALKTRVYLHMRDWNNVVTEAKKLEGGRFILPLLSFLTKTIRNLYSPFRMTLKITHL